MRLVYAALFMALLAPVLHAGPQDLCDPKLLTPDLLKTLSPAEQRCIWRHLKKDAQHTKNYGAVVVQVNSYGAHGDAQAVYEQSSSQDGKRTGKVSVLASSPYRASQPELQDWRAKWAGLRHLKEERIFVPAMEYFEGRTLILCEHRSQGLARYSEWLDSKTGLVLRVAGFDDKGQLFFARLFTHVRMGDEPEAAPLIEDSKVKILAEKLGSQRLEKAGDAAAYLQELQPSLELFFQK